MSVNAVNPSTGELSRVAGGTLYADSPIGTITPFGGSAIPSGYLFCNGQVVSRTTYAELFAVIGTAFGSGDGSTTFNVPDLREATTKGAGLSGKSSVHYDTDGVALGEFIEDRVQDHSHRTKLTNVYFQVGSENVAPVTENGDSGIGTVGDIIVGCHGATTEVKAVGVNYIIKAKQVAVPFDVAEYVRNQNVLSEYEDITLPTTEATAITMQYDGFLVITQVYSSSMNVLVYINGINITRAGGNNLTLNQSVLFKKGDSIYATKIGGGIVEKVAYYKLRDYSGRN